MASQLMGDYLNGITISIIIIIGTLIAYYIIRYFLQKLTVTVNLQRKQVDSIVSIAKIGLIFIGSILIIFQFSTVTGIVATVISLAGGTIIGFASINTVGNAVAGLLLLASRPFKLGDRIRISEDDGLLGDVVEITLLYTKIKTVRNELVSIPNQTMLQRHIVNYSGFDIVGIVIEISMDYKEDREEIESLLLEAARSTPGILSQPTPYVLLSLLDNFAAIYQLRVYTDKPNEYLRMASYVRARIYDLFQQKGFDLTTPNLIRNVTHEGVTERAGTKDDKQA